MGTSKATVKKTENVVDMVDYLAQPPYVMPVPPEKMPHNERRLLLVAALTAGAMFRSGTQDFAMANFPRRLWEIADKILDAEPT